MPVPNKQPFYITIPMDDDDNHLTDGLGRVLCRYHAFCAFDGAEHTATVPLDLAERYQMERPLIQDLFPELDADSREIILQYYGMQIFVCTPCQKEYWGDDWRD